MLVRNKIDTLAPEDREILARRFPDAALVSAVTGEGVAAFGERIAEEFERRLRDVELLLPYSEGARLAELHDIAGDLRRQETPDGVLVHAQVPESVAERFGRFLVVDGAQPA
jgi:GTP-binding protein HflX